MTTLRKLPTSNETSPTVTSNQVSLVFNNVMKSILSLNDRAQFEYWQVHGDNQSASNTFSVTIGVTVIEVLPNGNLIVAGEKQIAMNKGTEFIRFSGMVNPDTIGTGNVVPSTQVADARVEYRTNSQIDRAEMASMASRFFLSLLPF